MKKLTALVLGSMLIINSTAFAFTDFESSHWAYKNVMDMEERGIISGFTDNTFRPNTALTREQFITMAVKGLGLENSQGKNYFEDSNGRWSDVYVKIAGDTLGDVGESVFDPEGTALREDIAMSMVKLNGLENETYDDSTLEKFSDRAEISLNRAKYVAIAVEHGFMSGNANGTFAPKKGLTRAEGATVIFNMLNKDSQGEYSEVSNWTGEYISNEGGLVKIELEKLSDDQLKFLIKGKKETLFGGSDIATINGNVATYKYNEDVAGEIKFYFKGQDLVIETSGHNDLSIYEGTYKVNDGTITTIEMVTENRPLDATYQFDDINLEITSIADESVNFDIDGIKGTLQKYGDTWKYFDVLEEAFTIEMELNSNRVIVTGLNDKTSKLSGIYDRVESSSLDEYEKYETVVDSFYVKDGGLSL